MSPDSSFINPPHISPGDLGHSKQFTIPGRVPNQSISPVSVEVKPFTKIHVPETKPKEIDKILGRLSAMDFPGKDHVEEYLRHLYRQNCKPNTLRGSLTAAQLFLSFIKSLGKTEIEQITKHDIEAFVEHEQDRGLKIVSVRTRLVAIYAFLHFLVERGVVYPEVFAKKIKLRLPELLPRAIDPDHVKQLLSVLDNIRDRAMILVLLRTGMRIGELLNTRVSDINIEERKIAIYEGEKNSLGRVVYLSDDAICSLRNWLRKRDAQKQVLFYGRGHNPLCYQSARIVFIKYLRKAGLAHKGYTLHCLRHTFASELLNAGMRLECLQQLLGHSNLEVTRRYARLTDKTREEEYFNAMAIIERGEINGDYRLDS